MVPMAKTIADALTKMRRIADEMAGDIDCGYF
jgi:hypothetical protein